MKKAIFGGLALLAAGCCSEFVQVPVDEPKPVQAVNEPKLAQEEVVQKEKKPELVAGEYKGNIDFQGKRFDVVFDVRYMGHYSGYVCDMKAECKLPDDQKLIVEINDWSCDMVINSLTMVLLPAYTSVGLSGDDLEDAGYAAFFDAMFEKAFDEVVKQENNTEYIKEQKEKRERNKQLYEFLDLLQGEKK